MLDVLIKGAGVVDGTGAPTRVADVGIRDGRIVVLGPTDEAAVEVVDGEGLLLAPGFVDAHTHYDAQLCWDPHASPSNLHGVTTVISGNCGFTLAPLRPDDVGWTLEMMAEVEGMPLEALKAGVGGDWTTFAEYLDHLDGQLGVNAAFLVGHCALRRFVMGEEGSQSEASPEQLAEMTALLHEALSAGGLGFSSSQSFTHNDGEGNPIPSRAATTDEVLALCAVVAEHEGTTLEYITDGCLKGFTDEEVERLTAMSRAARRPLNWNVLTVDSRDPESVDRQLRASEHAEANGARVVALTMPTLVPMNMSFLTRCALAMFPYWDTILTLPVPERMERLRDPEVRRRMQEAAVSDEAGVLKRLSGWASYEIGDTYAPENKALEGRKVGDIAAERGTSPFDTLVDIVLADDLRTVLWPTPPEDDDASWALRMELLDSGRALAGGSDAGAHLDRMIGSTYPTLWLADTLRGRRLLPVERVVQLMTDVPARLFGLRERGRIAEGWHADLVLFDPEAIGSGPVRKVADLPAGNERLFARPEGIARIWVNGATTVVDGEATDELAGTLLRSGRDTETVEVP
jgi:N-acyl-D-aspartate/D-glutamate deacylase